MWFIYPDALFIRTILLGTKVSGLTRLDCSCETLIIKHVCPAPKVVRFCDSSKHVFWVYIPVVVMRVVMPGEIMPENRSDPIHVPWNKLKNTSNCYLFSLESHNSAIILNRIAHNYFIFWMLFHKRHILHSFWGDYLLNVSNAFLCRVYLSPCNLVHVLCA
jgi:hypothetical protein